MSENSLKIRGKFINKLATKIEDLNDNFILLSKVDKKIFKKINNQMSENMNNQRGGAQNSANNAILAALKKAQEMKAQQESLTTSLTKLQEIERVINEFTKTFTNITKIINEIQFDAVDLTQLDNINGLQTLNENTLTNDEITALTTYLNITPKKNPTSLISLQNDRDAARFQKKIDQVGFNILFGNNRPLPRSDSVDMDTFLADAEARVRENPAAAAAPPRPAAAAAAAASAASPPPPRPPRPPRPAAAAAASPPPPRPPRPAAAAAPDDDEVRTLTDDEMDEFFNPSPAAAPAPGRGDQ